MNRYYLLKQLQLATTEDDPDAYRAKQKAADGYEDDVAAKEAAEKAAQVLAKAIKDVVSAGTKLISKGMDKEAMRTIVSKHNGGNGNPSSIKTLEVCEAILEEFKNITPAKPDKEIKE